MVYNGDTVKPGAPADGVQLCPLPVSQLTHNSRNKVEQNTLAVGAGLSMMGIGFQPLAEVLTHQFKKKGDAVVAENVEVARNAYDYATRHFQPFARPLPMTDNRNAVLTGNMALAMGGAAAGVKFYCAYPMSPSTGVLHWMAAHARKAGIMVRQVEDEIGVVNMAIGAAHAGVRAMCATSGGGFALMTEGLGMSAMIETPIVVIDVQRAGPSTGVPTKTEQGDLWQMLGAGHGDYPRIIVAPTDILDCFKTIPEIHNLADRFQCPGIVLTDLLLSEGTASVDPADLDFDVEIDRGDLITSASVNGANGYKRYLFTESGVSPRAIPGVPGHNHTVATDEHMEDGVLISDEFTNPHQAPRHDGKAPAEDGRHRGRGQAACADRACRRGRDPHWLGVHRRRHPGGPGDSGGRGHHRQSASDPLDSAAAWRRHRGDPQEFPPHHSHREQLQRPICALPAQRDELCP